MYKTHLNDRVIIGASLGTLLESSHLKNLKYTSQLLRVSRQDCKRTSQLGSFTFVPCLKIKHKRNIATHSFIYRKRGNAYATQGKFGDAALQSSLVYKQPSTG